MPVGEEGEAGRACAHVLALKKQNHVAGGGGSSSRADRTRMAAFETNPELKRPELVKSGSHVVRKGHGDFIGVPGTWTREDLFKLEGRFIACPKCTIEKFYNGNCHVKGIVDAFNFSFCNSMDFEICPVITPPKFVSANTTTVLGRGGLHDVYVNKDSVFAGCYPPRGSPHLRELGFQLPQSVFGNPDKIRKKKEDKRPFVRLSVQPKRRKKTCVGVTVKFKIVVK